MKHKVLEFLRTASPFLITLVLWRLAFPWINSAGMLCIIPIFYCSFIKPVQYFVPFAIIFCFLLDYSFGTGYIWTIFYCAYYAIMHIQTVLDLTHTTEDGLFAFMVFLGAALCLITIQHLNFANLLSAIVAFVITCAFYIPITKTIRAARND